MTPSPNTTPEPEATPLAWAIPHPGTGQWLYPETLEIAMNKWFEGHNIPVLLINGKPEAFEIAHARVREWLKGNRLDPVLATRPAESGKDSKDKALRCALTVLQSLEATGVIVDLSTGGDGITIGMMLRSAMSAQPEGGER